MPAASSEVERPNRPATPIRNRGPVCVSIRSGPSPGAAIPFASARNDDNTLSSAAPGIFTNSTSRLARLGPPK